MRRIPLPDVLLTLCALAVALVEGDLWLVWGAWPYLVQTMVSLGLAGALLVRRIAVAGSAVATFVLLAAMAANVWTAPVGTSTSPLLLCAPLAVVALTRYGRARWWGVAGVVVALAGIPVSPALRLDRGGTDLQPFQAWDELAWMLAAHVLVVAVAYLWALRQREIADRHAAEIAALRDREAARVELATARERNRIAREVHDVVAHSVALIRVEAATGLEIAGTEPEHARRSLATIAEVAGTAMTDLRGLVGVLRHPPGAADRALDPAATLTVVPAVLDRVRAAGLDVDADVPGAGALGELDDRIDPMIRLAAVRVLQEALTNAVKHADHGAPVHAMLATSGDALRIAVRNRVADDPAGPTGHVGAGPGHGVPGLAERVGTVGGRFTAGRAGDDYVLTADLPLTGGGR
ncbi:sensor histidine kinase [Pseudonocardia sp. HH130630-07]|uniref:sensor histidine kinase n=1 Tax=Pseudonocardia sp. HH130630-07 TaxID=1690815 RepID=UPI000814E6EB|nr:histidine kinase [Pseudonocardia sp. HH130630-07]ANY05231.1 hypothetical protein AFB00_01665 [Pseudonocardia sp. HH130630-07]